MTGWALSAHSGSAVDTRRLAGALAPLCRPGDLLILSGGLGAGKTVFAQGFAAALGIEGPVTSPTFTLVRQYPCPPNAAGIEQFVHADLYRLDTFSEVLDLALPELVEDAAIGLVEWGEVAAPALGMSALHVTLATVAIGVGEAAEAGGDEARTVTIEGEGPAWTDRRGSVAAATESVLAAPRRS
jgi:tRNA threonylcarbamoyladenosine biosynthesis protein TsaE